jgi:hypothetical protein
MDYPEKIVHIVRSSDEVVIGQGDWFAWGIVRVRTRSGNSPRNY